ncbi:hypothetical protein [Corynebacterium nasicanis]|uniref:Gluconate 2-dehydrogenase subunit 3 family protein n=1 Tax=Corynebacterium nasicanis TaxID=1448267 RepID=A0ABW1QG05_9CORY
MSTTQGTLDQIAADIAGADTVEDVRAALIRECALSDAEAQRLVGVQADHLSTELFPAGVLPTGEVYDQQRYENWLTRELRTTFGAAVEKVEEDVAGFLRVVFGRGDEPSAEFNAAIFLGAKKRVAQEVSSVAVGYFCRDGIAHLKKYGAQWREHPFTSPGWSQVGSYEVNRDDEGL